jgi:hypothetical protein
MVPLVGKRCQAVGWFHTVAFLWFFDVLLKLHYDWLFGHRLHVGCMIISIQGRQITGETNALAIAQAHALRGCVLTISVAPKDNITWMADNIEVTRPSVESNEKTTAIASSDSTIITMSDNLDISDTSTIHSNAQSEAVTATFGKALSDNDGLLMG